MSWKLDGLEFKASLGLIPFSISQELHGLFVLASPFSSLLTCLQTSSLCLLVSILLHLWSGQVFKASDRQALLLGSGKAGGPLTSWLNTSIAFCVGTVFVSVLSTSFSVPFSIIGTTWSRQLTAFIVLCSLGLCLAESTDFGIRWAWVQILACHLLLRII